MTGNRLIQVSALMVYTVMAIAVQLIDGRSTSVFTASVNQVRHSQHRGEGVHPHLRTHSRKLSSLVEASPLLLPYHSGPILASESSHVYIVWYGQFSSSQRSTIADFFGSFTKDVKTPEPSVRSWWKVVQAYRDANGASVGSEVILKGEMFDQSYSKGKTLSQEDISGIVEESISSGAFPAEPNAIYFVLTADDVQVGAFCMSTCGFHHFTRPTAATSHQMLPFAWVGNSVSKCAGRCAWPFAKPIYGPQVTPLVAPNGDVGVDGMIINIATLLAGTVTNPFSNGFFQGDASAPLEVASACAGVYGEGAFPGNPGNLLKEETTGASFNALGTNGRQFLLPALWDPVSLTCKGPYNSSMDLIVVADAITAQ